MESDKEPLSFGRYLQAIRLEKKISLEQVASQTRIGLGNLLLIEQEDHERLPAKVYVKGFIRSYAAAIGADGDEAIRRYESRLDVVEKISEFESPGKMAAPKMWWKLLLSLVLLICIIGISVFAILALRNITQTDKPTQTDKLTQTDKPTQTEQPAAPATAVEKEPEVDTPVVQPDLETDSEPEKAISQKLMLRVVALEKTWLKVIIDEQGPREYMLDSGSRIELEARTGYNLLIGNAGGVKITLNDKPVLIHGKSGDVVTIDLP
jgi:cytoskeletal protein RodZ